MKSFFCCCGIQQGTMWGLQTTFLWYELTIPSKFHPPWSHTLTTRKLFIIILVPTDNIFCKQSWKKLEHISSYFAQHILSKMCPRKWLYSRHISAISQGNVPSSFPPYSITHLLLPICVPWCGNYGRVKMMCYAAFCCKMQLLQKKVRGESYFKRKRNLIVCASPMFLLIWRGARDKIWMLFLYTLFLGCNK